MAVRRSISRPGAFFLFRNAFAALSLVILLAGCEGLGGAFMMANPALARWASLSEEDAKCLPPEARYRWAYRRVQIEITDLQTGIRWRDRKKVLNASGRAVKHLCILHGLLARETERRFALEAVEETIALGEALSAGGGLRGGVEAAEALQRRIENGLGPPRPVVKDEEEKTGEEEEGKEGG